MKKLLLILLIFAGSETLAQDFAANMKKAKAAYNAGKLEETHFELQQAMQAVDLIIGKEVLKLLPVNLDTLTQNVKDDKVASNIGYVGTTIERTYGKLPGKASIVIISNSPMVALLNTALNTPMMSGMFQDGKTSTIKVRGYKARLEQKDNNSNGSTNFEMQIPQGSALITFTVNNCTSAQIQEMAEKLPLQAIFQLIQ